MTAIVLSLMLATIQDVDCEFGDALCRIGQLEVKSATHLSREEYESRRTVQLDMDRTRGNFMIRLKDQ